MIYTAFAPHGALREGECNSPLPYRQERDLFSCLLIEFYESLEGLEGAAAVDGLGGFGDAVGQGGVGAHEADGEGGIGDDGLLLRGCRTVLEHATEDVGGFVGCRAAIKLLRTESREA